MSGSASGVRWTDGAERAALARVNSSLHVQLKEAPSQSQNKPALRMELKMLNDLKVVDSSRPTQYGWREIVGYRNDYRISAHADARWDDDVQTYGPFKLSGGVSITTKHGRTRIECAAEEVSELIELLQEIQRIAVSDANSPTVSSAPPRLAVDNYAELVDEPYRDQWES